MKTLYTFIAIFIMLAVSSHGQVAVNSTGATPDASAMLDVSSTTHGILIPRMSTASRNAISNPALGLLVYDFSLGTVYMNTGIPPISNWVPLSKGQYWTRTGTNTYLTNPGDKVGIGTSAPNEKLEVQGHISYNGVLKNGTNTVLDINGTSTSVGMTFNTTNTGANNIFLGYTAGSQNSSGLQNTYIGSSAGSLIQTGSYNVLVGYNTGSSLTGSASFNVLLGYQAGPWTSTSNVLYIHNVKGTPLIYGDFANMYVGLNTETPGTNFAVYENNTDLAPAILIEQGSSGDAAQQFYLSSAQSFSFGIDNSDNDNFLISSGAVLGVTSGYSDLTTMARIHTENPQPGIIDFNHQSRARVWLSSLTFFTAPNVWVPVFFDQVSYDEHTEWNLIPGGQSQLFTALEDGYYQVNARTDFIYIEGTLAPAWCSIAIFKNGVMYSQGNNLKMYLVTEEGSNNNAPNVSDVVYLQAGETIGIHVYQSATGGMVRLRDGDSQTYCSIHKVS